MEFVTNEKLTIVGAAGMIGSNMASKSKYYDTSQAHQPPTLECGSTAFGALR